MPYNDLDVFAATWTATDLREFENAIEPLTKVDDQMWKSRNRRK